MFRYTQSIVVLLLACATMAVPAARGSLLTFDSLVATANSVVPSPHTSSGWATVRTGDLTQLVLDVDGVRITIKRQNNARFDIVDNTLPSQTGKGAAYGSRSLDPFYDTSPEGFIINFTSAGADPCSPVTPEVIEQASINMGDYGGDYDSLQLLAYSGLDGAGSLVDTSTDFLPQRNDHNWTQKRFDIEGGFSSLLIIGGIGDFDVFLDRLWFTRNPNEDPPDDVDDPENPGSPVSVVEVPEPATVMLWAAAGAIGLARRRSA